MRFTCRSFVRNERGGIAISAALGLSIMVGIAALAVDLGRIFVDRRHAQSAVDLAALAAASDLANGLKAARATVARNAQARDAEVAIEFGTYIADPARSPAARFTPAASNVANAARVRLQTKTPLMFGRALTGAESFQIATSATATTSALAAFAIGSCLVKIEGGLLNQLLGSLLGANLSLTAMDYQALVDAKLDVFGFLSALAVSANLTAGTYDRVLTSNVKVSEIFKAMLETSKVTNGSTSAATRALEKIEQSVRGVTTTMQLQQLVNLGPYSTMPIGQAPAVGVAVSAMDIASATAQLANGQRQVEVALTVGLPGILGASLKLAIGERPVGTSWLTVGQKGASVHTAQTRLLLTVQVLGAGSIASIAVPIYIEVASATAVLQSLNCAFPDVRNSTAALAVTPAVVDAWIAKVSNAEFNNFRTTPNPPAAALVDLPLIKVTGRAHVTVTNMSSQTVNFSYSEIQQQTRKTIGTHNFTASLLSKLVGDLQLDVSLLGLGLGLPLGIQQLVAGQLAAAVTPIDQVLSSVLTTLGIGVGQADVWMLGLRCDGAVLVN